MYNGPTCAKAGYCRNLPLHLFNRLDKSKINRGYNISRVDFEKIFSLFFLTQDISKKRMEKKF